MGAQTFSVSNAMNLQDMLKVAQHVLKQRGELKGGYYAVDGKRYVMDMPQEGKWKGWTFLSTGSDYHNRKRLLMLNPDGEYMLKTERGLAVYAAIVADPMGAMLAYGQITGRCGVCGRKLEDPVSVQLSIGPVCLGRMMESLV